MGLTAGTRLGPYEVLSALGSGGMGEVYRARDRKLDRDVAIKILPEALAADLERIARFEREAKTLAALNQPYIAQIYGLEESNGVRALVMELVEGPTLADRIGHGPIPLDEALPIAKQIAEALEAAHEQGIIHRDLKPANIKVRADGMVKVLDFGLAKALDAAASSAGGATMSPTLSIHATQAGLILGTAAYMAPEQARGKSVDKRADIWAFGCVLYEMLTGRRAFDGDDISTTLAAVLKTDPDRSALPPATPPSLRRLLSRCLDKDPKERLRDIGEARVAITRLLSGVAEESGPASTVLQAPWWRVMTITAATLLVGSLGTAAIISLIGRSTVARPRVSRLNITQPTGAELTNNGVTRDIALTPDGSRLIYVGANGTTLFVRALNQLDATPLVHGVGPRDPFVSPDGQWVGFFEGPFTLKKVAISGGPAVLVTQIASAERGATWAADGTIIFATASTTTGLQRVSASGGVPSVLTRPDRGQGEATHLWPQLLPAGEAVLYTVTAPTGGIDAASIAVLDLRSGRTTILLRGGSCAQYVPSGHLVYAAAGALRAIGFDATRAIVVGQSTLIVPRVLTTTAGDANAVLASDGTLVYVGGAGSGVARTLVWVDRQGHERPVAAPPRGYQYPRVSPDGTRVVMMAPEQGVDLWLWDLVRPTLTRLTFDPADDVNPVWTPDGRVVFSSNRSGGVFNLFRLASDSSGTAERLTENKNVQFLPLPFRPMARD
jgi:serine/threonine-protein kinase